MAQTADSARTGLFITSRAAITVAPVLCAAAYPTLSQLLSASVVAAHGSTAPTGIALWVSVVASLALALGVMAISFIAAQSLQDSRDIRGRFAAHVVFATLSLFVGFGNVANLWHTPAVALRITDLVPRAALGTGAAIASIILVGLLGFHVG